MLTASTIIIAIAFVVYRRTVRRREGAEALRGLQASWLTSNWGRT